MSSGDLEATLDGRDADEGIVTHRHLPGNAGGTDSESGSAIAGTTISRVVETACPITERLPNTRISN